MQHILTEVTLPETQWGQDGKGRLKMEQSGRAASGAAPTIMVHDWVRRV